MSTFSFLAATESDTDRLGAALVEAASSGLVVALYGTLGAGKTRFAQAIAAACGVPRQAVVSPTFVLCQEYRGQRTLYHLDAYRLRDEDEFLQLGVEEMFDSNAWVMIEWADRVAHCLPRERLDVELHLAEDDSRRFEFRGHGTRADDVVVRMRRALAS